MALTPQEVIDALADVRACGQTNMFDRNTVIALCEELGYQVAVEWLKANKKLYMQALTDMGDTLD